MELEDYPGYLIYQDGNIWSKKSKKFLKPQNNGHYHQVTLYKHLEPEYTLNILLHRLIAIAYLPNPNNYLCVNHKNFDKLDNRVDNLEWCTNIYNTQSIRQNKHWGYICFFKEKWRFRVRVEGKEYSMYFKTQEEAEEYREITKLFYEGLMLD